MRYLAAVPVTQPHDYRRNRKRSARVNHHLVIEIEGGTAAGLPTADQARSSSVPISIDDVISAVDIQDITGDELGAIEREKRRGLADIIDADQASGRCLALRLVEELIELRNA